MSTVHFRSASVFVLAAILSGVLLWRMKTSPSDKTPDVIEKPPKSVAVHEPPWSETPIPPSSLGHWKNELLRKNRDEAREWVLRELEGGQDYATGIDLAVGLDQNLSTWPSYRVFLLDMLHLIDPLLAAQESRELIESSGSADEWAVALRNVAKSDDQGNSMDWLRGKTEELFRNPTWRSEPSAGFLNAFDMIVFTEHTGLSDELLKLCDDLDQPALRHASFLALDRLVQIRPELVMPVLAESAERLPKSSLMISNMMARADLRDPVQRDTVERYLLDEARSAEEIDGFANVFPNANFHVSNNLMTATEGVLGIEISERDRTSLEVVEGWLEDGRFSHLREPLRKVQSRLRGFLE